MIRFNRIRQRRRRHAGRLPMLHHLLPREQPHGHQHTRRQRLNPRPVVARRPRNRDALPQSRRRLKIRQMLPQRLLQRLPPLQHPHAPPAFLQMPLNLHRVYRIKLAIQIGIHQIFRASTFHVPPPSAPAAPAATTPPAAACARAPSATSPCRSTRPSPPRCPCKSCPATPAAQSPREIPPAAHQPPPAAPPHQCPSPAHVKDRANQHLPRQHSPAAFPPSHPAAVFPAACTPRCARSAITTAAPRPAPRETC